LMQIGFHCAHRSQVVSLHFHKQFQPCHGSVLQILLRKLDCMHLKPLHLISIRNIPLQSSKRNSFQAFNLIG
jgi:hypothetical protein